MGSGIAQICALSGIEVRLNDIGAEILERALSKIKSELEKGVQRGKILEADIVQALKRIVTTTEISEAVNGVDFVIEAVPEDLELKRQVFASLDSAVPQHATLATNTSSISITKIASVTRRPESVVGMHFFNPPHLMKLVEIVRGDKTSDRAVADATRLAERLGKTCVVSADRPGFIVNRLLMPFLNEAAHCLMEGVASEKDIDAAVKLGLNHPMGPFELADFIGIDTIVSILEYMEDETGQAKYRPCPLLKDMVKAGKLGRKSREGFYTY